MEYLQIFPIHEVKEYIPQCCDLINSEWPRSKAARFQSLYLSCNRFPTSLVLIMNEELVVGHCKISEIRAGGDEVIIESVVIHKEHRGKGWGKIIMEDAEDYVRKKNKKIVYLSTRGQEGFYRKLGYQICKPINYFGFCDLTPEDSKNDRTTIIIKSSTIIPPVNAPKPPPLPTNLLKKPKNRKTKKTFMKKDISITINY